MFETGPVAITAFRSRFACAAACILLALAGSAQAQEAADPEAAAVPAPQSVTTTATNHGGWEVVCTKTNLEKTSRCAATYRVVNQANKANMLVWIIGRNEKNEPLTEVFTFPEVLIQPGVSFILGDAKPLTAQFVSCSAGSCKAALALDAERIKMLKQARSAKVAVTQNDGKVMTFNLDITGIDGALKELEL